MKEFKRLISIVTVVMCIASVIIMACNLNTWSEATRLTVTLFTGGYIGGTWFRLIDMIGRHTSMKRAVKEATKQVMGPQARL